jgi:hypothetical protein
MIKSPPACVLANEKIARVLYFKIAILDHHLLRRVIPRRHGDDELFCGAELFCASQKSPLPFSSQPASAVMLA